MATNPALIKKTVVEGQTRKSLTFTSLYVPNCAVVLSTGDKALFVDSKYTAKDEWEALLLESEFVGKVRRD
jgi:hypothetical protein